MIYEAHVFFASTKNCARFFLACKTWYNFLVKICTDWFPLLTEFLDLVYFLTAKPRPSKALLTTKYTKTYTKYASTTGDTKPSRPLLVGGSGVSRSLLREAGQPPAVRPYKRVHWGTSGDQAIPQDLVSAAERAKMLLIPPHPKSS